MLPTEPPTPVMVEILTCRLSPAERLDSALSQAVSLVDEQSIKVVEGPIGDDAEVDAVYDRHRARLYCKWQPTRSELAAYAAHRLAWRRLLESDRKAALILEDDFRIVDRDAVLAAVNAATALLSGGANIVKLFDFPRLDRNGPSLRRIVEGTVLTKRAQTPAGMVAYLISRDGAARFLQRARVFRVVDEDIKFHWELGLDIWSIAPSPIAEASGDLGGSLLEHARLGARRRRTALRSLHGLVLVAHRKLLGRAAFARYVQKLRREDILVR